MSKFSEVAEGRLWPKEGDESMLSEARKWTWGKASVFLLALVAVPSDRGVICHYKGKVIKKAVIPLSTDLPELFSPMSPR